MPRPSASFGRRFPPASDLNSPRTHPARGFAFREAALAQSSFALLGDRRFAPLFWTQAFGAFSEHAYVFRPPGTPHGPIRSEGGCVLLEVQYYGD